MTQLRLTTLLVAPLLLTVAMKAKATTFRNAYVSFELPDKWKCSLEHTEWVCRTDSLGNESREAIIVLTAKEVGPQDTLPAYHAHLKSPRQVPSRSGQMVQSTVYKVDNRSISGQPWVDGMHFGSEVPNYYTRYLATIKDKIAVLVTFSAYKLSYTKYSADFLRAIESLRVVATRGMMGQGGGAGGAGGGMGGDGMYGGPSVDLGALSGGEAPGEGTGGRNSEQAQYFAAIALIVGAVGVYLLIKRKKKGKK